MARHTQKNLKPQISLWIKKGLITKSTGDQILTLYPQTNKNYWAIAFSIIGSLLCLSGIILMIASNWEHIPAHLKITTLIILLLASLTLGIETKFRKWSRVWWECSFLAGGTFPLLGLMLISQIFHIEGSATNLLLTWTLILAPLVALSRSISSWILFLSASLSSLISILSEEPWGHQYDFIEYCFFLIIFGAICATASQLWRFFGEKIHVAIGEYWGLIMAFLFSYLIAFDLDAYWVAIWLAVFLASLALIYTGYIREKAHQVNFGFVIVGLIILSTSFRLIGSMLETGMLFLFGGITIIVSVIFLNKFRQNIIKKIK